MAKVMVVLVTELALLPVAYGLWLDVCALPLFEGSLQQRLDLLRSAPLAWTLLHWMLGMACLMVTAAFLSVVRGVLRPGGPCSTDTAPQLCMHVRPNARSILSACCPCEGQQLTAYHKPASGTTAAWAGRVVPVSAYILSMF